MVFIKKSTVFLYVFFLAKKARKKHFFFILDSKECFLDPKSEILAKSKKSPFCKGVSPWFLSKNRPFFHMFFFSQKSQKERCFHILDRKEYFLDLKSEVLKSRKNRHFANALVHGISQKIDRFLIFSFEQRKPERNIFWSSG